MSTPTLSTSPTLNISALRSFVIEVLLSPTSTPSVLKHAEQFIPEVGLRLVKTYYVYFHDQTPQIAEQSIVVDASTSTPINNAVTILSCGPEETRERMNQPHAKLTYLCRYFTNRESAEMVQLCLLRVPTKA